MRSRWRAREQALQRLFSMFPGGRPGAGLLLLRVAIGLTAMAAGVFYFANASISVLSRWVLGLVLTASGAALTIGFLTPFVGLLVGLCFLGIAVSWFSAPAWGLDGTRALSLGIVIIAVALALLGPGAFSLDGWLFGRREIIIPPSSRRPEP